MKRKAFILTEILTGMMLQAGFIIVLCGAFYMLLNFSTDTQQVLSANDKAQIVINYIDNRIRNAGIGMHECGNTDGVVKAFNDVQELSKKLDDNKFLPLPVAIVHKDKDNKEKVKLNNNIYSGNVLYLLYANKDRSYGSDNKPVRLILTTSDNDKQKLTSGYNYFSLIDKKTLGIKSYINSKLNPTQSSTIGLSKNIRRYAVMESTGVPVYILIPSDDDINTNKNIRIKASYVPESIYVYPMSELLNLECQKIYVDKDNLGNSNFTYRELADNGETWSKGPYYHAKDILELYMTLDTNKKPPIFTLKILVSEGASPTKTIMPENWHEDYWYPAFENHKVHVAEASWRLPNLEPLFH